MEETVHWDDSSDRIMDIYDDMIRDKNIQIPLKCPICDTNNAHIYMHLWDNDRGTLWTWCSRCKACAHASRFKLPDWVVNGDFVEDSELTSHPIFLDSKKDLVDEHLRKLLKSL